MRRVALVLGFLVLVAAGAFALFAAPAPDAPTPAGTPSAPEVAPTPGTLHAAPRPLPRPDVDGARADPAPPTRVAAPAAPPGPGTAAGLRVRVIDGSAGIPVPGAAVWVSARGATLPAAGPDALAPLWADTPVFADANGEASGVVAPTAACFYVAASDSAHATHARRVGWRLCETTKLTADAPILLTIDARRGVTLHVLDAGGAPAADVPLRAGVLRGDTRRSRQPRRRRRRCPLP